MGQQQLLLIVLSVIIVGIAITLGITLFSANAIEQKRNEVINECALLASEAQLYYRRPVTLGGGGKSFNCGFLSAILSDLFRHNGNSFNASIMMLILHLLSLASL